MKLIEADITNSNQVKNSYGQLIPAYV